MRGRKEGREREEWVTALRDGEFWDLKSEYNGREGERGGGKERGREGGGERREGREKQEWVTALRIREYWALYSESVFGQRGEKEG